MTKRSGQVSVEFLQILAVSLLVLVLFIAISQNQGADINRAKVDAEAKNAIADITGAAKEVYAQGFGAKKKVYVSMPTDVDPAKTYVANNTIKLNANGNDYVGMEAFDMHGTLPTSQGGHWIWVLSEGNKVRIGYAMIALSRQTLLVTMMANETVAKSFDITNIWGKPIDVTVSENWGHTNVGISLDHTSAHLDDGESSTFYTTFTSNNKAIGIYLSELEITATEGGNTEYVKLPVVVQVVADSKDRPPLTAIPPILNATLNWTQSVNKQFFICTNEVTSVSSVDFVPSEGDPGSWTTNTGSLGPIGPDSCAKKILGSTVPNGTILGNHTGYVRVLGRGAPNAEDSIALDIEVGGTSDWQGPIVRNISTTERRVHIGEPTTIIAVGDDSETGNSSLIGCDIRADEETVWREMLAKDGTYDSPIEDINYTYTNGFGMGAHTVYLRCTDAASNTGPDSSYTFIIGKDILFVISDGNETDWSNWMTVNRDDLLYDIATIDEIKNGSVNMYFYDAVIFIDWSGDLDFITKVLEYQDLGGFVGLFGDSAHHGVLDLDVAWHPDNPHPESLLYLLNDSHYVTQPFEGKELVNISVRTSKIYSVWWANTSELGSSGWFYPSVERILLAEQNSTLFWGPMDPWTLNENGFLISSRVIDYMINQSDVSD